jgi:hypothetical protein
MWYSWHGCHLSDNNVGGHDDTDESFDLPYLKPDWSIDTNIQCRTIRITGIEGDEKSQTLSLSLSFHHKQSRKSIRQYETNCKYINISSHPELNIKFGITFPSFVSYYVKTVIS